MTAAVRRQEKQVAKQITTTAGNNRESMLCNKIKGPSRPPFGSAVADGGREGIRKRVALSKAEGAPLHRAGACVRDPMQWIAVADGWGRNSLIAMGRGGESTDGDGPRTLGTGTGT